MSDDHPALADYDIDTDYCDVPDAERASVAQSPDTSDSLYRESPPSDDKSWTYGTGDASTLAGTELDEEIDQNAVIANDGRSDTRTMFYAYDAPTDTRNKWWRLAKINDGMYTSQRDTKNKEADNNRWIDTFTRYLGMTPYQTERVRAVIDGTPLQNMGRYSAQESILGAISIVCNEDDRWVRDDPAFERLVADIDSDMYTVRRVRDLLREKSTELDEPEVTDE